MFGERYFTARGQLQRLMGEIASLGAALGLDLGECLPLEELAGQRLGKPFLLAVFGETNAGKSALLNALTGRNICPMSALPNTKQVILYRHAEAAADVESGPLLLEAGRPFPVLRDFHLLDTPGLKSVPDAALRAAEPFLAEADAVFVVLPYDNPWAAPAWNFIGRLAEETLGRVTVIVQQADRADPADLPVIEGHLRDLSVKKTGRELPVFPVSAKLAFEARQGRTPDAAALARSGFDKLERHLSHTVCGSPQRHELLVDWGEMAGKALREVEDRLDWRDQVERERHQFLAGLELDIARLREHFIQRLPNHLRRVAEVFQREAGKTTEFLHRHLGLARSLARAFFGDSDIRRAEAVFVGRLQVAVEAVARQDGDEVVALCREHRHQLARQVKESVGVDLDPNDTGEGKLEEARKEFVGRVGSAAREGIENLRVRSQLAKDLVRRNRAIKAFLTVALALATAAGAVGATDLHQGAAWLLLGVSGVFLLGGMLVARLASRRVAATFQERLLETCAAFAAGLETDYEAALRVVFQEHFENLAPLRQYLADAKTTLVPLRKRWSDLFLILKTIEQDHLR